MARNAKLARSRVLIAMRTGEGPQGHPEYELFFGGDIPWENVWL